MFEGMLSAIATPFQDKPTERPAVDFESLEALVDWQLRSGVNGIVVCGSTGEAATLNADEKIAVIRAVVTQVKKQVPVIAGTGSNDTAASVELTKSVKELGVDGVLAVSPYYNKPTQDGLLEHFRHIAKVGLPVIVYNIPGRSVVEISMDTFRRLAAVPGIVAVKQAVDSAQKLVEAADALGDKVALLAGDDPITYSVMTVGGRGVISASGTVIPKEMLAITDAARKGDWKAALEAQKKALPLIQALFLETNPIPAKAALKILGHIKSDALRLPLTPALQSTKDKLRQLLSAK